MNKEHLTKKETAEDVKIVTPSAKQICMIDA